MPTDDEWDREGAPYVLQVPRRPRVEFDREEAPQFVEPLAVRATRARKLDEERKQLETKILDLARHWAKAYEQNPTSARTQELQSKLLEACLDALK